MNKIINSIFLIPIIIIISSNSSLTQSINKDIIQDMKFRHIGPIGNRLTSVAGIPNRPLIYYVGAASGGVWKTEDGGLNWNPIFDLGNNLTLFHQFKGYNLCKYNINQYSTVMHNIISSPYVIFSLVMIPGEGEFKILIHL